MHIQNIPVDTSFCCHDNTQTRVYRVDKERASDADVVVVVAVINDVVVVDNDVVEVFFVFFTDVVAALYSNGLVVV